LAKRFGLAVPERTQLWESVLETLRMAIVTGELAPGTHLLETQLSQELGVSRWPVRQAIARLEQEHLVVTYARRGAFVAGLSEEDIHEIYALRHLLEGYAMRRAAERVKPEHLERLHGFVSQLVEAARIQDMGSYSQADTQFHQHILEVAGSRRLLEMWQLLMGTVGALLAVSAATDDDLVQGSARRHHALATALETRDPEVAETAIREHLVEAERRILGIVEKATQE